MKRCTKCVLPETHETILFDKEGVFNICQQQEYKEEKIFDGSDWLEKLQSISAQYPTTFTDQISGHQVRIREVFNKKIRPRKALDILRKEGIIWV